MTDERRKEIHEECEHLRKINPDRYYPVEQYFVETEAELSRLEQENAELKEELRYARKNEI